MVIEKHLPMIIYISYINVNSFANIRIKDKFSASKQLKKVFFFYNKSVFVQPRLCGTAAKRQDPGYRAEMIPIWLYNNLNVISGCTLGGHKLVMAYYNTRRPTALTVYKSNIRA